MLFDRNRFSGVVQRTEEYLGLVWRVIEGKRDTLRLDADGSFTQQNVEVVPNIETREDYRVNVIASIVSPRSESLALKLEYQLRYDNLLEPDFAGMDRIFTSGIQLSF